MKISESDVREIIAQVTNSQEAYQWDVQFNFLDGTLDSLDHASVALSLEERHGVKVPDDDLPQLNTIQAIIEYVDARG